MPGRYVGGMTLPRSTPSAQGVDATGLLALLDALETPGHGTHSLMVARHGQVIAEGWWAPYRHDRVHLGYSLSKSFTATVLGGLVGQGLIDLDAPVLSYLVDDVGALHEKWQRVTVRNCITMTVGHSTEAWDWRGENLPPVGAPDDADPLLPQILAKVPDGEPGQVWAYNQVATYLVAQAIAAVTGEPLTTHVRRLLLEPFGGLPGRAQRTLQGRDLGFSGLHVTTPAILALAQSWLDGGRWQGADLVPAGYAAQAPRPTPASLAAAETGDWGYGYGCSFWNASHGYRGDGAYGQYAIVLPEHDVAVAITSEVEDMQHTLDLLWTHLLPAVDADVDPASDEVLARRLTDLGHPPLTGEQPGVPTRAARHPDSQLPPEYAAVSVEVTDGGHQLLRFDHPTGDLATLVGNGQWLESAWPTPFGVDLPIAASGGWRGGAFTAELRVVETPHTIRLVVQPDAGTARLDWRLVPLTGPDPLLAASHPF